MSDAVTKSNRTSACGAKNHCAESQPANDFAVTPGDVFCVRPGDDPGAVRVCVCAEPDERRLEQALNTLARLTEADRSAALPVV